MRYLLDVNSLVALGFLQHEFHERVANWVHTLSSDRDSELATCSITELGLVRILTQAPQYGMSVMEARELLPLLKSDSPVKFVFIVDNHDISHLPLWVKSGRQTTDGHLAELAKSNHAVLATLDQKIPQAFLIPR